MKPGDCATLAVPREWNGAQLSFPADLSVVDLFRAQAKERSKAVAVKEGSRIMTYAELDLRSNRVSNALLRNGLPLEHPVVILRSVSCEFIAAILGVLKAGGSYLPIALDTPKLRFEFLLKDSGTRFALTDAARLEDFDKWPGLALEVAPIISASSHEANKDPGVRTDPHRRVYVGYTSGSTGQPKGVEIEHHSWTNLICNYHRLFGLTSQDRSSLLSYPSFDISVADIWPTLCVGGCLVVPPQDILLDPDRLIAWLAAEEVTFTFVPTGVAEILFKRPWPKETRLRWFTTGGDRLRVRPPLGLPFPAMNLYGPTENTVVTTFSLVAPDNGQSQPPPIGRPLANLKAYVLDEGLVPVDVNVPGELYVGGEQVARGYLGRPDLTAAQFLSDPFAEKPGRMYRTGDWVRWTPEGELDFLGRHDDQIQIRGIRVELGEIDAALCSHEEVRQACSVPLFDDGMPAGVTAHVVLNNNRPGLLDELRLHLQERLPSKSVPTEFLIHDQLPLTPQGKVDRAALKTIPRKEVQTISAKDGLERALQRLWQTMLPHANIAEPNATFQASGGDSLLLVKLMLSVEEITGQKIEASTFLLRPTLAGLYQLVKKRLSGDKFEPLIALREEGTRTPLFCIYGLSGDINFSLDFANAMGCDQPVWGVRSPALASLELKPDSMRGAAEEVRRHIRQIQPRGIPALLGYSWGGLLAFEVSRQFSQEEGISCFTALVGSDIPMRSVSSFSKAMRLALFSPPWVWKMLADGRNRGRRLSRWRNMLRDAKEAFDDPSEKPLSSSTPLPDWASEPLPRHLLEIGEKYRPAGIHPFRIDLFREQVELQKPVHPFHFTSATHLRHAGWAHWTKVPPRVHIVPGTHDSILKPPLVATLAKAVRLALDEHFHSVSQFQTNGR